MNLHISYASDNNFAQYMGISVLSLLDNNQAFEQITIHILDNKISEANKENLKSIVQYFNREIVFYDFSDIQQRLNHPLITDPESLSKYCRLFLPDILPDLDKILYLDSDSIVVGSFMELWQKDVSEYLAAAVIDHVTIPSKLDINIEPHSNYFNTGMLLINLKKCREENVLDAFMDFIKKRITPIGYYDQGVINAVINKSILKVEPRYNLMTSSFDFKSVSAILNFYEGATYYTQEELDTSKNNPVFIHFTPSYSKRPWIEGCRHPMKEKYLYYKSISPWKNEPLLKDTRKAKHKLLDVIFWTLGPKGYKMLFSK